MVMSVGYAIKVVQTQSITSCPCLWVVEMSSIISDPLMGERVEIVLVISHARDRQPSNAIKSGALMNQV